MARSRERMMPETTGSLVADHLVEIERGLGLIDQGRDVADVHGLVQVDELAVLPQAVEELAEILLHRGAPEGGGWVLRRLLSILA